MKATIHVTLKRGILDPQGKAIEHALETLGYDAVTNVRVGKHIELDLDESAVDDVESQVKAMCEKLLANTIIEEYTYELESDRMKELPAASSEPVVELTSRLSQVVTSAHTIEPSTPLSSSHLIEPSPSEVLQDPVASGVGGVSEKPMERTKEQENASRLARKIVTDIVSLSPTLADEGVRKGTLRTLLREDWEEGLRLYCQRVPDTIRSEYDFYDEAIDAFIYQRKKSLGLI
jgi:phosphoribosylformylglycinamidine synthase